jgi:hypothetical protein
MHVYNKILNNFSLKVPRLIPYLMKSESSFDYTAEPSPNYANAFQDNRMQCDAGSNAFDTQKYFN